MSECYLHGQNGGGGVEKFAQGVFTSSANVISSVTLDIDFTPDEIVLMPFYSSSGSSKSGNALAGIKVSKVDTGYGYECYAMGKGDWDMPLTSVTYTASTDVVAYDDTSKIVKSYDYGGFKYCKVMWWAWKA